MKNLLTFFLLLALAIPNTYAQQWSPTGQLPFSGRYDDVYFVNPEVGWAVNGLGQILKTENGGESWAEVFEESFYYFRCVEFINEMIGFAGRLDGALLRTEDGGDSWTHIEAEIPQVIPGLCGLSHAGDHVFGVGLWSYPAFFIKSEDQGITWTYKDMSIFADGLVECHFLDENIGFVSGTDEDSGAVILKTTDGGDSWDLVLDTQGGAEYIWKLDFVNDTVAYGSVESFGNSTRIVKTIDGGNNWAILQVTDEELDIQGIGFINENKGWIGPRDVPMYETNDGGESWLQLANYPNINRFFRVNEELMYASGYEVYKYTSEVMSSAESADKETEHAILSVSPNPFTEKLKVTLKIDNNTYAKVTIFNLEGKKLLSLQDGPITKGIHDFESTLLGEKGNNNDVYILSLRTNEGFKSKKMVRAKEKE